MIWLKWRDVVGARRQGILRVMRPAFSDSASALIVEKNAHLIISGVVKRARRKRDDARNGPRALFVIGDHPPTDS